MPAASTPRPTVENRRPGTILEVPDPAEVTRPDGTTITVVGGRYVVEHAGEHKIRKP